MLSAVIADSVAFAEASKLPSWHAIPGKASRTPMLFGVIAYNLGNLPRRLVLPVSMQSWSLTSLRQRMFKTGGRPDRV